MDSLRTLRNRVADGLVARNQLSRRFFAREAERLALACREMASRFSRGGRLFACGLGSSLTDAQHVAVEFVHPVIVGKRALPAFDVSSRFCQSLSVLSRPEDILMAFDPSGADPDLSRAVASARARGMQTFALAGRDADYAIDVVGPDPFVHQEIVEILYHVLWETVHVFLEHEAAPQDAGRAAFLYPFLTATAHDAKGLIADVAGSLESKARDDELLRREVAEHQCDAIAAAVEAVRGCLSRGGKLLLMGNGGSATDATDWALDCIDSPKHYPSIPALSLATEAAVITALANDVGQDLIFLRQIIAHAESNDVVIAMTTSGGSANVIAALEEARKQGLLTVALTGNDGGEIARQRLVDFEIRVRSDYIPRIQEVHASIYHVMTDLIAGEAVAV